MSLRRVTFTCLLLPLAACAAPEAAPAIVLVADVTEAEADGASKIGVQARVAGAALDALVSFTLQGPGLVGATTARAVDGVAAVDVFAPFEDELRESAVTSTVVATMIVDGVEVTASLPLAFRVPDEGEPVLFAHTAPDRVVVGTGASITLIVDGRRLSSRNITVESDSTAVTVPATLELDEALHAELVVPAPTSPVDVPVRLTAEGAAPVDVVLHFIDEDAPAFDVSGTFAKVLYGVVEVGGLVFLDPDPQCVVAPTFSLVHVTQDGAHLTLDAETCDIKMPAVNVVFVGRSTTTVTPAFIAAGNDLGTERMELDLDDVGPGASFDVPTDALPPPLVLGAELASPADALPTAANDARVRDHDGDGQPGVTVKNSSQGDQHCAIRMVSTSFSGTVESSDVVSGENAGVSETKIFNGAGIEPRVTPKGAPFTMVRVDGRNGAVNIQGRDGDASSISCEDVKAFAAELMSLAPAPSTSTACL